ncbi:DUF1642 domain-containing protein [Enterococcus faecalis]
MNEQELIEELECLEVPTDSLDYLKGANYAVEKAISLAKQLDEPKKVVVPPIIDKFIRENEDPIYEICAWSDHYGSDDRTCGDPELSTVINWFGKNSKEFYQAVINGYEVMKEPLYYVKLPLTEWNDDTSELETKYVYLAEDITSEEIRLQASNAEHGDWKVKLTEDRVKSIDERYWPFAVKADGGE